MGEKAKIKEVEIERVREQVREGERALRLVRAGPGPEWDIKHPVHLRPK